MRHAGEGLVTALIGAFAVWGASLVPPPPEGETWAGVLPMGAAIFLTLSGLWMAVAGMRMASGPDRTPAFDKTAIGVLALFAVSLLYQQGIVNFGYELPTAIAGPIALWMFGVRNKVGLALSALLFPLAFHVVFFRLLGAFPPFGEVFDLMDSFGG